MLDRARDYNSREGAQTLADTINRYWAARGKRVRAEAVPDGNGGYTVRSNLSGGRP